MASFNLEKEELEQFNIKYKIEEMLEKPREVEDKNNQVWTLKVLHESGHHIYEMGFDDEKREATKIITANAYDYRAINNREFDEPWIEINGDDVTFNSKSPNFSLKLDSHIQIQVRRIMQLQNNKINDAVLRMFELVGMKEVINKELSKYPDGAIKTDDETEKDIGKWKSLMEKSYTLNRNLSYEQAESISTYDIEDILEARKNGWVGISNNKIEELKGLRRTAKEELGNINAKGELTDEQWNRACDLEDKIQDCTEKIKEEMEKEKVARTQQEDEQEPIQTDSTKKIEEDNQKQTTDELEEKEELLTNLNEEIDEKEQEDEKIETEVEENITTEIEESNPEIATDEPIEKVHNMEKETTHRQPDKEKETVKTNQGLSEKEASKILKEFNAHTNVPMATPVKKKWREIIAIKIKELAQKGKETIDNWLNR